MNETIRLNNKVYKRVNKTQAIKAYNSGKEMFLIPAKANIYSPWVNPCFIGNDRDSETLNTIIGYFEYYNCVRPFGKYAWFYIAI